VAALVKAAIKKARQALKSQDYSIALAAFAEAENHFLQLSDPAAGLEGLYFEWSNGLRQAGQPDQALKKMSLYLESLQELTPELQVRIQYLLAQCHYDYARQLQKIDPDLAHQHFHKALGYHGLDPFQRADAYYQQGVTLMTLIKHDAALASLESALTAFQNQNESFWAGMTRLKIGMLYLMQDKVDQAMTEAQSVIQSLEGEPHSGEQAVLLTAYELMYELSRFQRDSEGSAFWKAKIAGVRE
jgi:tetratricopeptide (TPR) repeat protein